MMCPKDFSGANVRERDHCSVPPNGAGMIRLFHSTNLVRVQLYVERAYGTLQVLDLCRADDGSGYAWPLKQPRECDLGREDTQFFRDTAHRIYQLEVGWRIIEVDGVGVAVGAGRSRNRRFACARQPAASE